MIVMSLAVVIPLQSSINDMIENQKKNKTGSNNRRQKKRNEEKFLKDEEKKRSLLRVFRF